jgi:hypothetical protein
MLGRIKEGVLSGKETRHKRALKLVTKYLIKKF